MKILCLHAMGTSGTILDKQLAPLKHALGGDHEWVCVDGLYEHEPHSSVKGKLEGPYLCFHKSLSATDQADAHDYLREIIEDDGPFDGILGFSQGASLATSFLLQHKIDHPYDPAPFRFAILFNANLVVSPDQHFCEEEITKEATKLQKTNAARGQTTTAAPSLESVVATKKRPLKDISKHRLPGKKSQIMDEVLGLLELSIEAARSEGWAEQHTAVEGKSVDDFPRVIHPVLTDARIDIPTSLITGKEDQLYICSLLQKRLCNKGVRNFVVHNGGHDIPKVGAGLDTVVNSCKWAMSKAEIVAMGGSIM